MTQTFRTIVILTCVWIIAGAAIAQTAKSSARKEPSYFTGEDCNSGFDHAHPPSDAVLAALLKTKEAKEYGLNDFGREENRKLFKAVKVHLGEQDEAEWIVLGSGRMSGADNDWFWVVRDEGDHARVLLFATGLALVTLKSRTNSYKDIKTSWNAASGYSIDDLYQYDGTRYKLVRKHAYMQRLQ